jgi:hypothetical protein
VISLYDLQARVMRNRLSAQDLSEVLEYTLLSLVDLVDNDLLDDVTRGYAWTQPGLSHEPKPVLYFAGISPVFLAACVLLQRPSHSSPLAFSALH